MATPMLAREETVLTVRGCNACGMVKPLSEYYFLRIPQVWSRRCKACLSLQSKARRAKDPDYKAKERERARRQRRERPDINLRACQKWREAHRERFNAIKREYVLKTGAKYTKKWRAENRERYNAYMRNWKSVQGFKVEDETALVQRVEKAVPHCLPYEVRSDVCQELLLAVLSRVVQVNEIESRVSEYVKFGFREYLNKFGPRSLDSLLTDDPDGLTLGDCISIEEVAERLHVAWEANRLKDKARKGYGSFSAKREPMKVRIGDGAQGSKRVA